MDYYSKIPRFVKMLFSFYAEIYGGSGRNENTFQICRKTLVSHEKRIYNGRERAKVRVAGVKYSLRFHRMR